MSRKYVDLVRNTLDEEYVIKDGLENHPVDDFRAY